MRNRSKSIHTSVPHSLENEEKPDAPSDEEMEITELEQVHSDGEESGGKKNKIQLTVAESLIDSVFLQNGAVVTKRNWLKIFANLLVKAIN